MKIPILYSIGVEAVLSMSMAVCLRALYHQKERRFLFPMITLGETSLFFFAVYACHTCTVLSLPAEAMREPSGDHCTAFTWSEWPL